SLSAHPQKYKVSFFFSSRRRHTRFSRDWSSDVCSSDLVTEAIELSVTNHGDLSPVSSDVEDIVGSLTALRTAMTSLGGANPQDQIGRASCREGVYATEPYEAAKGTLRTSKPDSETGSIT